MSHEYQLIPSFLLPAFLTIALLFISGLMQECLISSALTMWKAQQKYVILPVS